MAAGSDSNPSWSRHLFRAVLMVFVALLLVHSSSSQSYQDFAPPGQQKKEASADLLTQIGRSLKETLDAWLGPETMHVISEVRNVLVVAVCINKRRDIVNTTSPCHHNLSVLVPTAESPTFCKYSLAVLPLAG